MYVCLRVLVESNKSIFDSYNVRNIVLIISHFHLRDCRVHIYSDSLSRNSYVYSYFEPGFSWVGPNPLWLLVGQFGLA